MEDDTGRPSKVSRKGSKGQGKGKGRRGERESKYRYKLHQWLGKTQ